MFVKMFQFSNITVIFLKCMLSLGLIRQFNIVKRSIPLHYPAILYDTKDFINFTIKINKYIAVIKKIYILSTSTRGLFVTNDQLKNLLQKNLTIKYLLHTPQYGLIDCKRALKLNTGGELICSIVC